jgi:hypothetical protein
LDLREHITETFDTLSAKNILCLPGAGIYAAMWVLLDKNDHAVVVVPNYQSAGQPSAAQVPNILIFILIPLFQ